MPRTARIKGIRNTYHIIQRGNERKNIFLCDEDRYKFLDTLERMKKKYNFELQAYCLMDNHVHLLINDNGNDISKIIKSINISYAYYFNKVYRRIGHLFQDRFGSEVIENDKYHITVSAYIHDNPVRAGMVKKPEDYYWSSMNVYMGKKNKGELVEPEQILNNFSTVRKKAMQEYYEYVRMFEAVEGLVMDVEEDLLQVRRQSAEYLETREEARKKLEDELKRRNSKMEDMKKDKTLRKEMMEILRKNSALTLAEIGELCGGFSVPTVSVTLNGRSVK